MPRSTVSFYRPYWSLYRPYYRWYRPYYNFFGVAVYIPYDGGYALEPYYPALSTAPDAFAGAGTEDPEGSPPPDNAAHLQLVVPEDATVLFDGNKSRQTGGTREFVSPPLTPGRRYTYRIAVRYTGPDGKPVDDQRDIYVRANDWFRIDFTQPAPAPPGPGEPPPVP